ncbi:MAG TPA: HNH endonuclease signature motif containing protein [Planctomycetota bacterium]
MSTEDKVALTDDVMSALEQIAARNQHKQHPDIDGPMSVKGLKQRLHTVYADLQEAAEKRLRSLPAYKFARVYQSPFYHRSPHGAYFKTHVYLYAGLSQAKTKGRLQLVFGPNGTAYGEYVAYPGEDDSYHIRKLSEWLLNLATFENFRTGLLALPEGFELYCKCSDGTEIDECVHRIPDASWNSLARGLSPDEYFTIAKYHRRDNLRHLTVGQLADLLVGDIAELSGLYPLLQCKATTVGAKTPFESDDVVQSARTTGAESDLRKLELAELVRRALASTEMEGATGPGRYYSRDVYIAAAVKKHANGFCDLCGAQAPFKTRAGEPYLELHHIKRRADGGADKISNVAALCPNCHRKIHHLKLPIDVQRLEEAAIQRFDTLCERR